MQTTSIKYLLLSCEFSWLIAVLISSLYNSKNKKENKVPNQHQLIDAAVVEEASQQQVG